MEYIDGINVHQVFNFDSIKRELHVWIVIQRHEYNRNTFQNLYSLNAL